MVITLTKDHSFYGSEHPGYWVYHRAILPRYGRIWHYITSGLNSMEVTSIPGSGYTLAMPMYIALGLISMEVTSISGPRQDGRVVRYGVPWIWGLQRGLISDGSEDLVIT